MLQGKTVILGITGSIAAYKMANVASMLVKQHCDVHVIMSQNATHFINPITFETLTGNKCLVDTFDRNFQFHVAHVSLAQRADVMLIAPATANVIQKLATGAADDMLTTTALNYRLKKLVAPAMNTGMLRNVFVQKNLQTLRENGFTVITPAAGHLACGDVGEGKLPDEQTLFDFICREIAYPQDYAGRRVLVTAGPTREALDPVRFLSNHSTGKMGYAIARAAAMRGAEVTLVSGPVALAPPPFVTVTPVVSAQQMCDAVLASLDSADFLFKAAAVADYRPREISDQKLKKADNALNIPLERTTDILQAVGERRRPGQLLCGFSMETQNMLENSRAKLRRKHLDMIVANNLKEEGAGFGVDTNRVTVITEAAEYPLELMSKDAVAHRLLDLALAQWEGKR